MFAVQILSIVGAVALLCYLSCLVALHVLPTGFHPVSDAVSNYAVGPYGFLYQLQAFSSGLSAASLLAILAIYRTTSPIWGMIALGCFSLSRIAIIAFPTDIKPPLTAKGVVHMVLATTTFVGIAFATAILSIPMAQVTVWSDVGTILQIAACITAASVVATLIAFGIAPLRNIAGVVERCIISEHWRGLEFHL